MGGDKFASFQLWHDVKLASVCWFSVTNTLSHVDESPPIFRAVRLLEQLRRERLILSGWR